MPHLIIFDRNGNPIGDPNEGHRETEDLHEHTPSGIVFAEPTPELAKALLNTVEKYRKKE